MQLVDEAIRNWENARNGVLAELDNIPEDRWDYRPGPGARSVRELAYHIAESGAFFAAELGRPDGTFARFFDERARAQASAKLPATHSKAEFLQLLRTAGEQGLQRLRQTGDELAGQRMPALGGEQSRLSALWFAVGHESYHRGQIATYARGLGLTPALTHQMAARQARSS
jgi:uncharacterized damage-inducible protein DinB